MTLEDVRAVMYGNDDIDPIAGSPSEVIDSENKLLFKGTNTNGDEIGEYRDHLRMVEEGHGIRLSSRQYDTEPWNDEGVFYEFEQLHGWIYTL